MNIFRECLAEQLRKHPSMQAQDVIKMCYQAANGGEHLVRDVAAAQEYFTQEFAETPPTKEPFYELISCHMVRVNLGAWKAAGLPGAWLCSMFLDASKVKCNLTDFLNIADEFDLPGWKAARQAYEAKGMPSVHHSQTYREQEKPAYRVVNRKYARIIPILQKAAALEGGVIAIDGRAASGKTTMASSLSKILEAPVISMDDFFLPMELRTKERFCEAGGNIHYERFRAEVLPYIQVEQAFSYRRFDCNRMNYSEEPRKIEGGRWRIVEGSYSLHPSFGQYADITVFSQVDEEEQARRILRRDGEKFAQIFREKWIPLEEKYFTTYQIEQTAHIRC